MEVRPADPDDAARIGEVHVRAWQGAYRGLMPDAYLDGLDPAERAAMWRQVMAAPPPGTHLDVVLDDGGAIAGFAASGPDRDGAAATGELYAINLDPPSWGHGLGGALVRHVAERLAVDGFAEAVLWVATGNERARAVYERLGWSPDRAVRTADVLGATVDEVRYRNRPAG
jgi:ribosomal protein S18 acetylase RimI-like enzyme